MALGRGLVLCRVGRGWMRIIITRMLFEFGLGFGGGMVECGWFHFFGNELGLLIFVSGEDWEKEYLRMLLRNTAIDAVGLGFFSLDTLYHTDVYVC